MLLEVISTCLSDVRLAESGGADRIELVTALTEGGLTPSFGLIEEAVKAAAIPIFVMVRPHSRSFCYDRNDVRTMRKDILAIKRIGAAGIVVGALTADHKIDVPVFHELLGEADGLPVTFHRAFDEVRNQEEALEHLSQYVQVCRILTSGGKNSVLDAVSQIKCLVEWSRMTHITIMAGSGLNLQSLVQFVRETGVREVHFGTGVRGQGQPLELVDELKVREVKEILETF